jgi:hypothetical protein
VSRLAELDDGFLVVVKSDCETCQMVEPVLGALSARIGVAIASQDDPSFPPGLGAIDDTDLELSWDLQTETTPTLYRIEQGKVLEAATGWNREEWERLTGIAGLGEGLPASRPGCGSKIFEPGTFERLNIRSGALRSRRVAVADGVDPFEAIMSFGWSDGLPVVPPTEDRVRRMLTGTSHDSAEIACVMAPDLVECTVEKVAINAVMAGCKPEYLPVVLAACEAVATDLFNIHGVAATTQFAGPVLIVNGPIRQALQMNSGINALGPGNRANATIGRAVNLVVRNLGGARPGGVDRSTLGSPAKWSLCFAEDEEGSPWEPLSIERGMAEGVSAVSAFAGHGPHEIVDQASRVAESLASSFAAQLRSVGHPKLMGLLDALVVVAPEHARVFTDSGWDKPRLRHEITERLTFDGDDVVRGAAGIAEGMPRHRLQPRMTKFRPEGLWFVHAGGTAGMFSGIISGWTGGPRGSQMATVSIDSWK